MSAWIDAFIALVAAHPYWLGVVVFLVAASEAVVLIGYIVPGVAILLAIGALAGLGHVPLLPVLVWAAAGAVAGDGFSFWLGYRYRHDLRARWPFSRYPAVLDRGEAFFRRHGGKSIVFGRFVPVLKPIIPTVAGVMGMPPARFYVANVISALLWSPAHILPGVLLGTSLGLLRGVSARLVVVVLGAAVLVLALAWGARVVVTRLAPFADRAHRRVFAWALSHPHPAARRLAAPFDPDHPGTPALLMTLSLLVAASLMLVKVVEDVVTGDPLVTADHAISNFVTGLRNPWTDPLMLAVTTSGDAAVVIPLIVTVLGWLAALRAWRLAGAVALALASAAIAVAGIKAIVHIPRPEQMYSGIDAFAFPSGHTTLGTVLFGLTAWLIAGGSRPLVRTLVYGTAFGWVIAIAASRVYLGAHWPSDVLGALMLGTLVCTSVAILYAHVPRPQLHPTRLALAFAGVFVAASALHLASTYPGQLARYAPGKPVRVLTAAQWLASDWRLLPAHRVDLGGEREEELAVQWSGDAAALERRLLALGWQRPPPWSAASAIRFLQPDAALADLPAPPALHDGLKPVVLVVRAADAAGERWMFRAWPSGFESRAGSRRSPVLVASVVRQRETHPGAMLTLPRRVADTTPPRALLDGLAAAPRRRADGTRVWLAQGVDGPTPGRP